MRSAVVGVLAVLAVIVVTRLAIGGTRWTFSPRYRGRVRARWAWPKTKAAHFVAGFVVGFATAATTAAVPGLWG
jgi:hypothetical protein